jgi:hypothetical protein
LWVITGVSPARGEIAAAVVVDGRNRSVQLSYRSAKAPGGTRTRDLSMRIDNRNRSGPQQMVSSRSWRADRIRTLPCGRESKPARRGLRLYQITGPLRPATIFDQQTRQDSNPDLRGWSSPCFLLHHGLSKRTARIERASPEWRSGALPAELRPRVNAIRPAGLEPATSAVAGRRSVPLSYGRVGGATGWGRAPPGGSRARPVLREREPPAGFEPAPRPYKGRVLAVDTTEAWRSATMPPTAVFS